MDINPEIRKKFLESAFGHLKTTKEISSHQKGYYPEKELEQINDHIKKVSELHADPNKFFGYGRILLALLGLFIGFYFPFLYNAPLYLCVITGIFIGYLLFEVLHRILIKKYLMHKTYAETTLAFARSTEAFNLKTRTVFPQYIVVINNNECIDFIGKGLTEIPRKDDFVLFEDLRNEIQNPAHIATLEKLSVISSVFKVNGVYWHLASNPQYVTIELFFQ